jgi:hypothetical protein
MKTFEEAVKILRPKSTADLSDFYQRYMCLSEDVKACEALTLLIDEFCAQMRVCCVAHVHAEAAAQAKAFFHFRACGGD